MRGAHSSHHDESHALASHARKGRERGKGMQRFQRKRKPHQAHEHKEKDMSKVQCYKCDKYRHYDRDCPIQNKGRRHATTANVDEDPPNTRSNPAEEFFFISALSGTVPTNNNVQLIGSGASRHMTGYKEHLIELVEKDSRLHVVLGNDARYVLKGIGTTSLQLYSGIPLHLSDVLFVPGMRRNLVSISTLEDKGYKVAFSDGKVLAWHKNSSMESTHVIGVREDNLYRLTVRPV